jgi:membrane-bound lytic murein transglycosylase A
VRARARWVPVSWGELPGFNEDRTRELWPALLAGCAKPADGWASLCTLARALQPADDAQAREFLQRTLQPYRVETLDGQVGGLATGHYRARWRQPRAARCAARRFAGGRRDLATRKPVDASATRHSAGARQRARLRSVTSPTRSMRCSCKCRARADCE